jgi:hypothetical protein
MMWPIRENISTSRSSSARRVSGEVVKTAGVWKSQRFLSISTQPVETGSRSISDRTEVSDSCAPKQLTRASTVLLYLIYVRPPLLLRGV